MGCLPFRAQPSIICHLSTILFSLWYLTRWKTVIFFLLFFLPLPPDTYFCIEFYCFCGLCPPAPRVLYTKITLQHRITWEKQGEPLALPLLPSSSPTPLKRSGSTFLSPLPCGESTTFWFLAWCCDFTSAVPQCLCRELTFPKTSLCLP